MDAPAANADAAVSAAERADAPAPGAGARHSDPASAAAAAASAAAAAGRTPRFTVKKWNAVAVWSWAISNDVCAICRNNLHEPSIEYQASGEATNEDGLRVSWGACGHVYHHDCVSKWLRTRSNCPMCSKEWEVVKIEKISHV